MKSESYKSSMPWADEVVLFKLNKTTFESTSAHFNTKKEPIARFFKWWEQVDATRTGINEIVNKKVIDFLVLLIAIDNDL